MSDNIAELSKDTKFSMRTLLLLCIFGIGCWVFGLNPKFFGYELLGSYRAFSGFLLVLIGGQWYIASQQYGLDICNIRQTLYEMLQDIKIQIRRIENIEETIHELQTHIAKSNNRNVTYFKTLSAKEKLLQETQKILREKEKTYNCYNAINTKINGNILFWLAGVLLIIGIVSCIIEGPIYTLWYIFFPADSIDLQTITLDIHSLNINCLIKELPMLN
ncbi:MAG: hypothetical protein J6R22_01875 [Alphaproteobacteria bacterium]|nr:hypothetical protein [Alphaproteobacteria bacterium]